MVSSTKGPSPFALVNYHLQAAGLEPMKAGNQKVRLTSEQADKLNGQLGKLTDTDRTAALQAFDHFKDQFEIVDRRPFMEAIGNVKPAGGDGEGPSSTARTRSVREALSDALSGNKPITSKEMKEVLDAVKTMLPKELQERVMAGFKEASADGTFKANTEARPAMVKSIAQADQQGGVSRAAEGMAKQRSSMLTNLMAKAKCFEDLVAMFMFQVAQDMQEEVKDKMDSIRKNDPNMPKLDRAASLVNAVKALPPDTQKNIAGRLEKALADGNVNIKNTDDMKPLQGWLDQLGQQKAAAQDAQADGAEGAYGAPKDLPPIDNAVARAMAKSDDPQLRDLGAIAESSVLAKDLEAIVAKGPEAFAKMSEDDLKGVAETMGKLERHIEEFKGDLPEEVREDLMKRQGQDMVSRQTQFEELKMLMNEYSQVMQALSNILSTMDNLAMHSIRKIEAR